MHATERRVPFLDALRSIAILLVINQHTSKEFARVYAPNLYTRFPLTANGWIGVDLFFVLSGYFIGTQLWKELDRSGTIAIGRFMLRRGLRIWPLYFVVFALVTIFSPNGTAAKQYGWSDLVFLSNYFDHGIVMGSWSLSTEEQFYVLTPLVLLLAGKRSKASYRRGLVAVFVLVCAVRELTYFHLTGHWSGRFPTAFASLYYRFHTHCDGLIAGLLVALAVRSRTKFEGLPSRPALVMGLSFVGLVGFYRLRIESQDFAAISIFFGSVVWWGVTSGSQRLRQHIFYVISRLSFGMYLNHEYIQNWMIGRVLPRMGLIRYGSVAPTISGVVLVTICSMAAAGVTFCLVEHPFLMIRTALLDHEVAAPLVAR